MCTSLKWLLVLTALAVAACAQQSRTAIPESLLVKDDCLKTCKAGERCDSYCACAMTEVRNRFSLEEWIQINGRLDSKRTTATEEPALVSIGAYCIRKVTP